MNYEYPMERSMAERPKTSKPALRTSKLLRVLVVGGAVLGGAALVTACPAKKSDGTAAKPEKGADQGGGVSGW
jgi:hypothetical protein